MNGKNLLRTLFEYVEILIHPSCWGRNYKFNKELDKKINHFIEYRSLYRVRRAGCWLEFTDDVTHITYGFWIENKYYASLSRGSIQRPDCPKEYMILFNQMPSRRTVLRFFRAFKEEIHDEPRDKGNIKEFFKDI